MADSSDNPVSLSTRPPILQTMDDLGSATAALMPSERAQSRIVALAQEIDRLRSTLRGIAYMDCYTRNGEEPAHLLMMRLAKEALS